MASTEQFDRTSKISIPSIMPGEREFEGQVHEFEANSTGARLYAESEKAVVKVQIERDGQTRAGTGFFAKSDGTVVTDYHVVKDADSIKVITANGSIFNAKLDQALPRKDLASLKFKQDLGDSVPTLPLAATARDMKYGDPLFAIGHPHGWSQTYLSPGHVLGTNFGRLDSPRQLVMDGRVHTEKGNSGSAVLNEQGEVVGVALALTRRGSQLCTVDDVHELLGDGSQASFMDYIVPKELTFSPSEIWFGGNMIAMASTLCRRPYAGKIGGALNLLSMGTGSILAAGDRAEFQQCLRSGAKAEAATWGLNMGADVMLMSGVLGTIVPAWAKTTRALQIAGSGFKLADQLCKDRQY